MIKLVQRRFLFGQRRLNIARDRCTGTNVNNADCENSNQAGSLSCGEREDIKQKILASSLPFVHVHGWTKEAISAGAESVGYPGIAHGLFPNGGIELVHHFNETCNYELSAELKKQSEEKGEYFKSIRDAVEKRLKMIVPYLNKWPQAIGLMALPQNAPSSMKNLAVMLDDICYYAGDRSVDFSWYSRRMSVGIVYQTTQLCLIQDKSVDFIETWHFLDRRVEDLRNCESFSKQAKHVPAETAQMLGGGFITLQNMLGLNVWNR